MTMLPTMPNHSSDLARMRADHAMRARRHADGCVLLAVVTSTDVAAALIDQAVALHATLGSAHRETSAAQPLYSASSRSP